MESHPTIRWKCIEEKVFLDFPYLQVIERLCTNENAANPAELPHRFYVVQSRDWCNIIPFTEDGKIVLIRQFRAGTLDTPYEFPGGVVEADEGEGDGLAACALRELLEETGYSPISGAKVRALGKSFPNPALQDNQVHSFLVGPIRKTRAQSLDPSEDIVVEEKSVEEFLALLAAGQFTHALMLTSLFFLVQELLGEEGLAKALRGRI